MKASTTPEELGPTADGSRLRILWADQHESFYEPRYLRLSCRCAGCVDELSGRPTLQPDHVPRNVHPLAIHYVGRYAIRFDWSDQHRTGIYSFQLLRKICPCPACTALSEESAGER
jgi:DUF971 family protein